MKIVFMGTPDFAVGTLSALIDAKHDVAAVVTQTDKPSGRGMQMRFSPVKECAQKHGIRVLQPEKIKNNTEFESELAAIGADVFVVVAYGKILPESILALPRLGCVNVHASLLPKYRGSAPIQWCVAAGEKESGVTTMLMDKGMDTGDILDVAKTDIPETMTGGELHDVLAKLGADIINITLKKLENGTAVRIKQDDSAATYVKMLSKADGRIDFTKSAQSIADLIRGFDPWPSAYACFEGIQYKLFEPKVEGETNELPGTLISADADGVRFACGDGRILCVSSIQAPTAKRMKVKDFLNGHKLPVGERADK